MVTVKDTHAGIGDHSSSSSSCDMHGSFGAALAEVSCCILRPCVPVSSKQTRAFLTAPPLLHEGTCSKLVISFLHIVYQRSFNRSCWRLPVSPFQFRDPVSLCSPSEATGARSTWFSIAQRTTVNLKRYYVSKCSLLIVF